MIFLFNPVIGVGMFHLFSFLNR